MSIIKFLLHKIILRTQESIHKDEGSRNKPSFIHFTKPKFTKHLFINEHIQSGLSGDIRKPYANGFFDGDISELTAMNYDQNEESMLYRKK